MLKWLSHPRQGIKNFLADDKQVDIFFSKLESSNIDFDVQKGGGRKGLTNEQKLTNIQALLPPDFNEEKAKEIDPAFEVLWTFLKTAVDYRVQALTQAKADYDARKAAAEGADPPEPFEEPELTTIDDDFEGLTASG